MNTRMRRRAVRIRLCPRLPGTARDVRLRAVIDDNVEIGITVEHREQYGKLRRLDECVQTHAKTGQQGDCRLHARLQDPFRIPQSPATSAVPT